MLQCLPQGICSWDYRIPATEEPGAELSFNFWGEQGRIVVAQDVFEIKKAGFLSAQWNLELGEQLAGSAHKPNPLFRKFEVDCEGAQFTLQPVGMFSNSFEIVGGGRRVGLIQKAHLLTRRASIDCSADIPYLAQLFAFWLVVLIWRRESQEQSTAAGAGH